MTPRDIIVGISGASGARIGLRLVEVLAARGHRPHVIISRGGWEVLRREEGITSPEALPIGAEAEVYPVQNVGAAPASGTFPAHGMVVCPCSMGTLARIASGSSENLLERAADVTLKERRRLVLVPRESPLSTVHLENMLRLANQGAVIVPAVAAFYTGAEHIGQVIDHIVTKVLDQLSIDAGLIQRWQG